jgi:tRNA(Ile)-lysidine synthase
VNYHHREQADEEESFIRRFCAENNVPLHVLNAPFEYSGNFEAAARTWRYDWFAKTVRENGLRGVLVAHHEDDLLETYFMQEEKNLVPSYYGLKEDMMYKGVLVKRPLLSKTKADLTAYCRAHGIPYYIDHTNNDESLSRNRIRHQIVAPLSRAQRDMVLREIRMKNAVMQERSCRVGALIRDGKAELSAFRRMDEDDRLGLIRKMIEKGKHYSLSFIRQIDGVLMTKNDFDLAVDERHLVQQDGMFFMVIPAEPYSYTFRDKAQLLAFDGAPCFRIDPPCVGVNALSVSEDDFPLTIRNVQKGDCIEMRFGTKKVHRFFIDRHIPLYLRKTWPAVVNREQKIIMIPGLGCDVSHFSVSPDFNVLQLTGSYLK